MHALDWQHLGMQPERAVLVGRLHGPGSMCGSPLTLVALKLSVAGEVVKAEHVKLNGSVEAVPSGLQVPPPLSVSVTPPAPMVPEGTVTVTVPLPLVRSPAEQIVVETALPAIAKRSLLSVTEDVSEAEHAVCGRGRNKVGNSQRRECIAYIYGWEPACKHTH